MEGYTESSSDMNQLYELTGTYVLNKKNIKMKTSIKQVFAIIFVIILGAIGSGVWNYLLEPCFTIFSGIILKILTLGIKGLENDIYLSVAKGFHESSSLTVFAFLISGITAFLIFIIVYNSRLQEFLIRFPSEEDENISNEGYSDVQTLRNISMKRYRFIFILVTIFLLVMVNGTYFRYAYVNDQITYYQQLYDTVAPFIDEEEKLMIKSKFAQIKSKNDYDVLINQLKKIADENNQTYAKYTLLY